MYIHIGKDSVVNSDNIIAIFNINSLEQKKSLENICKDIGISDNIVDVSDNNKKTLIICEIKNIKKGYITNISSTTIAKRCKMPLREE
jgi:hypothetical protein